MPALGRPPTPRKIVKTGTFLLSRGYYTRDPHNPMRILALLPLIAAATVLAADAPKSSADREKAWKADIFPILEKSCIGCHGKDPAKKPKGGLNLMTLDAATKGGKDAGAGFTWGDASKSSIYKSAELGIKDREDEAAMPPKKSKSEPLTAAQLAKLKAFIEAK